jgi:hypothetical protein
MIAIINDLDEAKRRLVQRRDAVAKKAADLARALLKADPKLALER